MIRSKYIDVCLRVIDVSTFHAVSYCFFNLLDFCTLFSTMTFLVSFSFLYDGVIFKIVSFNILILLKHFVLSWSCRFLCKRFLTQFMSFSIVVDQLNVVEQSTLDCRFSFAVVMNRMDVVLCTTRLSILLSLYVEAVLGYLPFFLGCRSSRSYRFLCRFR